ncbi:VOC family protein [Kribbella sp. CA-247076]|uniref:VOC family protein n=1 Tax=Kribbella sp. CA-247076 TaxID=3239941 RepID=UPI003D91EA92
MADEEMGDRVAGGPDAGTPYRPVPVIDAVAIDCADAGRLSGFWQALLGGELRSPEPGVTQLHGGRVRLDFIQVPETKQSKKNRLHLDLYVPPSAKEEAIARALDLGATPAPDIYDGPLWETLRDPEGNEFCLVWGAPE